jgi:tetratricopeptide (TPR) repeat protein
LFEGLVARIVPTEHPAPRQLFDGDIDEAAYTQLAYRLTPTLNAKPYRAMMMNSYRDPEANRSGLDEQYGTTSYFELYARLAYHFLNKNQMADARRALDTFRVRMPPELIDWSSNIQESVGILQETGELYQAAGDTANGLKYLKLSAMLFGSSRTDAGAAGTDEYLKNQFQVGDLFMRAELYDSARSVFSGLRSQTEGGNQLYVDFRLAQIDARVLEQHGDKRKALAKLNEILTKYAQLAQMGVGQEIANVTSERNELAKELGVVDTTNAASPAMPDVSKAPTPDSTPNPSAQGQKK